MRVALGIVVGAIIVLCFTMVVDCQNMAVSSDSSYNFYSVNSGLGEFKTKMAQMIANSADQEKAAGSNEVNQVNQGMPEDLNLNTSGTNSSGVNGSADNQSSRDLYTVSPIPINSPVSGVGAANSSGTNSSGLNGSSGQPQLIPSLNSSENSSYGNQSLANRTSYPGSREDSAYKTDPGSDGGSMISQTNSLSPSGVNFDNQASFNGAWSMQADRQGFGKSGINDRMALSGDFNVHKTVSFKD